MNAIQIPPTHRDTWGMCSSADDDGVCHCSSTCQRDWQEAADAALWTLGEQLASVGKYRRTRTAIRCVPTTPAMAQRWIRRYRKWQLDETLVSRIIGPAWCSDMTDMRDVEFTWLEFESGLQEWRERRKR